VRHHHRVDVRVHDAGVRVDVLRDLVHVPVGGQPRADVQELRDSLAGAETYCPLEEATILAGQPRKLGNGVRLAVRGFPSAAKLSLPPSQ